VTPRFEPLSSEPAASRRFGLRAIETRTLGGKEPATWARAYEERLLAGSVNGRLYVVDGQPTGLVSWSAGGPLGISVDLLYASEETSDPADYARILSMVEEEAGPVAFVSGPLAGLAPDAEDRLMRPRGFRRYGRSEMVLDADAPLPEPSFQAGERFRPAVRSDRPRLAELHQRVYHERFDRYLFLEVPDEREDALRGVGEILDGRWGEFTSAGSWLCERDGRLIGAILSVHSPAGALIADVMVEPEFQGGGVGRRLLTTTLRSLRGAGERRICLNVTEGNEPALRLYRRLGLVRSLGPTRDWYNALRIPVAPSPDA
jgi:ribosomal protein S18 acetylase RimI-like enzyme